MTPSFAALGDTRASDVTVGIRATVENCLCFAIFICICTITVYDVIFVV